MLKASKPGAVPNRPPLSARSLLELHASGITIAPCCDVAAAAAQAIRVLPRRSDEGPPPTVGSRELRESSPAAGQYVEDASEPFVGRSTEPLEGRENVPLLPARW